MKTLFPVTYPTQWINNSDDTTNNDKFRTIHRELANYQIKEVATKARTRKIDLEKNLTGYVIDNKRVHKVKITT
jgi:hypothetical protein